MTTDITAYISTKETHVTRETFPEQAIYETYTNAALPDGPKMLMICDSFRIAMIPFLTESVRQLDLMMNEMPSMITVENLSSYDIIIYEAVERNRFWLWAGIYGLDGEEEEGSEGEYEGE